MNNKTEDSEALFGRSRRVPVVVRAFEHAIGHMVGMADVEFDGVNMVARITLDHIMVPRLNTVLAEFSILTDPEAYQDEPEVVETNEAQLPIFEDDSVFRLSHAELDEEPVSLHSLIRESLNRAIANDVFGGVKLNEHAFLVEVRDYPEAPRVFEKYTKWVPREKYAKFEWREQLGDCPCGCGGIYDPPITKEIDDV